MQRFRLGVIGVGAAAAVAMGAATTARADILIAVNAPLTGQYATFGEQMRRGAALAIADLNAAGGVLGQPLRLIVGDDACNPHQAVSVAHQTAREGAVFVAGHYCSGASIPASQVYTEEGILQISPASTNLKLTDEAKGPNVFRVCGRDDQEGALAAQYIAQNYRGRRIAIRHDNSAYGKDIADATKAALNAAGLIETVYEAYTTGKTTIRRWSPS